MNFVFALLLTASLAAVCFNKVNALKCYNCQNTECHYLTPDELQQCGVDDSTTSTSIEDTTSSTAEPNGSGSYACYAANFNGLLTLGCTYVQPGDTGCETLINDHSSITITNCVTCTTDGCNNTEDIYYIINIVVIILIVLLVIAIICVIVCVCCVSCTACACCSKKSSKTSYNLEDCGKNPQQAV